ncbi:MAG: Tm-1-like ATP-binding domain-containing protein [Planctomycetaceae bacterium]|nr:Tm-1-like ATP-binding domain-containing protein [Planctomycetaceae bacterium]
MTKSVVVLSTLDTKGRETAFLKEQIEHDGCRAILCDIGVVGSPTIKADISREQLAEAGGTPLAELLQDATREKAAPVMVKGAAKLIGEMIKQGEAHAVIGLGGTQGTSSATGVMRQLPYGFPKLMVSTCAAGDTSAFVGIKDIMMMFSVSDILGLNPFMRKVLANAAGAACGMANVDEDKVAASNKPLIGMSNLGVLTKGAEVAVEYLESKGYEVIMFHAVGAGGRAMEQMMREGLITGVFDYAMGEISDELHHALRAGGPERLTVAGKLGLPQVLVPGGSEHIGLFLAEEHVLPEKYKNHMNTFHSPIIAAPRLNPDELVEVAKEIGKRLQFTKGDAVFMIPLRGTSRYGVEGGPLRNPESDKTYFAAIKASLPKTIEVVEKDLGPEDPEFVKECCDRLISLIEAKKKK